MQSPVQIPIIQLMNLSDSELSDLITEHRQPDGGISIPVDNWGYLSQEEVGHLAARLQAVHRRIIEAQRSKPLDVAYLESRMTEFLNGQGQRRHCDTNAALPEVGPQPINGEQGQSDNDSVTEVPDCNMCEYLEEEAYHDLVNDGGRPLYPIHLLRNILDDPEKHQVMLRPFWCHPSYSFLCNEIFQRQLKRWQEFRHWQLDNRGLEEADDGYEAHVAKVRKEYTKTGHIDGLAKIDADPSYLAGPGTYWRSQQRKRNWERAFQREPGCRQFPKYQVAARARLTRHGYADPRRELKLHEDPKRQDALTTWMEYLCFECWWLDHYAARLKRLQPAHDAAWAKLQESGLLLPDETAEFVRSRACVVGRSDDMNRGHAAYLAAGEAVERARSRGSAQAIVQKAADRMERAKATFDRALARSHAISTFIKDTKAYQNSKEDMERQPALVDWVAQQVALVREEMQRPEDPVTTEAAPTSSAITSAATTSAAAPASASVAAAEPRFLKRKSHDDDNNDDNDNSDNKLIRMSKRRKIPPTAATNATKNTTTAIAPVTAAKPRRRRRQLYTQDASQDATATGVTTRKARVQRQGLRRSARVRAKALRRGLAC